MSTSIDELYDRIPHVDRDWAARAMTELRLRDVSGADIGAAMAEVDSHMAEHGGDIHEVFGDPATYAAALDLPDTDGLRGSQWVGVWLPSLLLYAGVSMLLGAVVQAFGGGELPLAPMGIVLLVLVAVAWAVVRCDLLRVMVTRPVVSGVVLAALIAGIGVLTALVPGPRLDLAPAVAIPAGGALVAAGILLLERLRRRAVANAITLPRA
ncbi:hypothetical protein ACO0LV_12865 [Pseudactinotalea sp. Z1739]|uniref:hypothetical protein n=1 Tax=Pseudactinotalea sp. Z1739 TaxID=3413028 RepID=UPI003C7A08FB